MTGHNTAGKVAAVTLAFWAIKILATTLGETAGDAVTMSLNLGYWVGSAIFAALFALAVTAQIRAPRFRPWLFWGVIIATTTFGTTLADLLDRSLGIGYAGGVSVLLVLLFGTLAIWRRVEGTVSMHAINSRQAEIFYWLTVMLSQTLGTALGDWMSDTRGLGYEGGALVFLASLGIVALAYYRTRISHTVLFWAAFILTRPLGATLGDLLDKPHAQGGLALNRFLASAALAGAILLYLLLVPQRAEQRRISQPST